MDTKTKKVSKEDIFALIAIMLFLTAAFSWIAEYNNYLKEGVGDIFLSLAFFFKAIEANILRKVISKLKNK